MMLHRHNSKVVRPGLTLVELVTVLAIWGALIIAGVYMLRAIRSIWHGEKSWPGFFDVTSPWRKLPFVLLLAGLIVFGCFPRLLTDDIKTTLTPVARQMGEEIAADTAVPGRPHG